uniref:Uncharacterized protein n=1 Tax=viral metagenome TaxID=1070528 RepID=A0A6M3KBP1_9ZZZZ
MPLFRPFIPRTRTTQPRPPIGGTGINYLGQQFRRFPPQPPTSPILPFEEDAEITGGAITGAGTPTPRPPVYIPSPFGRPQGGREPGQGLLTPLERKEFQAPQLPLPPEFEPLEDVGGFGIGGEKVQELLDSVSQEEIDAIQDKLKTFDIKTPLALLRVGEAVAHLAFGDSFDSLEPWQQQVAILVGELPIWAAIPAASPLRAVLATKIALETSRIARTGLQVGRGTLLPVELLERAASQVIKQPFKLSAKGIRNLKNLSLERIGTEFEKGAAKIPGKEPTLKGGVKIPSDRPTVINKIRETHAEIQTDVQTVKASLVGKTDLRSRLTKMVLGGTERELRNAERLLARVEVGESVNQTLLANAQAKLLAFQIATKAKMANISDMKKVLVDYIKETLPPSVRGAMVTTVKNLRTAKGLEKAITKVGELAEASEVKSLHTQILKEVKATKPKVKGGILRGRFGADVQKELNDIRANLGMDADDALNQINKNIDAFQDGTMSWDDMLYKNEVLQLSGTKGKTAEQLQSVLDNIQALKKTGRSARKAVVEAEKARIQVIRDDVVDTVTGGKGLKPGTGGEIPASELTAKKGWFEIFQNWQYAWDDFMDKLSFFEKGTGAFKSRISQFGNTVHEARNLQNLGLERQRVVVRGAFEQIFGTNSNNKIDSILKHMRNDKVDLGAFTNSAGNKVELKFTKGQIIKKYQELLDPTLEPTFRDTMKWTDEMMDAVKNSLTPEEKAWGDWQLKYYSEYYDSINQTFRRMYGIDLPNNPNYSPILREGEKVLIEDLLLLENSAKYATTLNNSLKSRVKNKVPLKYTDATDTLMNHIEHMEHFKAFTEPIRDLRRVFNAPDVKNAIRQYRGSHILKVVNGYMDDMARDSTDRILTINAIDRLRAGLTKSILGAKPALSLKQIPSILAYMTEMPMSDFFSGVNSFWKNPVKNFRFLREHSIEMRTRWGSGHERDIKLAMQQGYPQQISGKGKFTDKFLGLIRGGDKFATIQGNWAKFKYEMKGLAWTEENIAKAISSAERTMNRTQPSFGLESLSPFQKGGSLLKAGSMFQNQPNKYYRIISGTIRNLRAGRITPKEAAKNLILTWVVLPSLFQFISDAFQFKPLHQIGAVALGPARFILGAGSIVQSVADIALGRYHPFQVTPLTQPIDDATVLVSKMRQIIKDIANPAEGIDEEDVITVLERVSKFIGAVKGYPTPYAVQVERAIREGDIFGLVFSDYAQGEQPKRPVPSGKPSSQSDIDELRSIKLDNVDIGNSAIDELRNIDVR